MFCFNWLSDSKVSHASPRAHIREIITAIDSSIFRLHFKLLLQGLCKQVVLIFPKGIAMCS